MTDNDIIKVLECCSEPVSRDCEKCPLVTTNCLEVNIEGIALDLINRQKAEIEEKSNKLREVLPIVAELKAEAITEFAERLKAIEKVGNTGDGFVYAWEISKIAKEMKGEQ